MARAKIPDAGTIAFIKRVVTEQGLAYWPRYAVSFTFMATPHRPNDWRYLLSEIHRANDDGLDRLVGQEVRQAEPPPDDAADDGNHRYR